MSNILKMLEMTNPKKYSSLVGKDIKIKLKSHLLMESEVTGKCLTMPPPLIIRDLYRDIFPSLSVSVDNGSYTAHVPIMNIEKIYKVSEDYHSKVLITMVCNNKNLPDDISKHIVKFMEGWTVDVPLY